MTLTENTAAMTAWKGAAPLPSANVQSVGTTSVMSMVTAIGQNTCRHTQIMMVIHQSTAVISKWKTL
jgi:hypothetical protein